MNRTPLVILAGPTAAGKTALSIALAKQIGGEIISADSMQVYKQFDIGTAKIRPEETEGIPHHLIDILEPDDSFHVYAFQQKAKEAIDLITQRGHIPILTGGTGFYIQAVLYDITFTQEDTDQAFRKHLEELAETNGAEALHKMLADKDPEAAAQIHPHNIKRVIRALEFWEETGEKISKHNEQQRARTSPYNFAYFVLNMDRARLYERINLRVDLMFENGLLEEVKGLLDAGISPDSLAMQGLGYKETCDYLHGKTDFDTAVNRIKQGTRHFAKRQITWFKREPDTIWLDLDQYTQTNEQLDAVMTVLKEKNIVPLS